MKNKRLTRDLSNKMLLGVCSGVAKFFGIDPTIVRVIWAILFFAYGAGLLVYLVMAFIMPVE